MAATQSGILALSFSPDLATAIATTKPGGLDLTCKVLALRPPCNCLIPLMLTNNVVHPPLASPSISCDPALHPVSSLPAILPRLAGALGKALRIYTAGQGLGAAAQAGGPQSDRTQKKVIYISGSSRAGQGLFPPHLEGCVVLFIPEFQRKNFILKCPLIVRKQHNK